VDGTSLEQHHGFEVDRTAKIFRTRLFNCCIA